MPNLPRALCRDLPDPELFFGNHTCGPQCDETGCRGKSEPGRVSRIQAAKAMCDICPERLHCAIWAIENQVRHGIWGSMTERERTRLRINAEKLGQDPAALVQAMIDTQLEFPDA